MFQAALRYKANEGTVCTTARHQNCMGAPLLYAHFPDRCPADWIETLFKDLKQLVRPPERIKELVAKLDDDSYRVREQATKELIELCRAFNFQLREVHQDKLSVEAQDD